MHSSYRRPYTNIRKWSSRSECAAELVAITTIGLWTLYTRLRLVTVYSALELPVTALIPANILLGVDPLLVYTSAYEFISAQNPQNMKGLLVGLYLTIWSFFQLLSLVALFPFSVKSIWESQHMRERPPVTNCGFGYLLFTCVASFSGLILLFLVAKRYKNRESDDRPYDYQHVEEVIVRQIDQRLQRRCIPY